MEAIMAQLLRHQIAEFFTKSAPTTQQQCDKEAERLTGGSIHPTPVQGGSSYTVVADDGTIVVQFRAGSSALGLTLVGYVKETYGTFVPRHESAGRLGELYVYTMDNVGGVAMYLAREQLHDRDCGILHQTVQDFARFFASAWHNTPISMPCPSRDSLFTQYSSKLSQLARGLPKRFRPTLGHLIANLSRLFAENWPLVPNHNHLLENNIHVNPATGKIVGICAWGDATISPFGMALGGLETMLGIRRMQGWCYHTNQQGLRDLFWWIFYDELGDISENQRELIELARLVGIFLGNGFEVDGDGNTVPASEGHETLQYLEAVTLGRSGYIEH